MIPSSFSPDLLRVPIALVAGCGLGVGLFEEAVNATAHFRIAEDDEA